MPYAFFTGDAYKKPVVRPQPRSPVIAARQIIQIVLAAAILIIAVKPHRAVVACAGRGDCINRNVPAAGVIRFILLSADRCRKQKQVEQKR